MFPVVMQVVPRLVARGLVRFWLRAYGLQVLGAGDAAYVGDFTQRPRNPKR